MGNELHLQDYCTTAVNWLSPLTRQSANRPCKTKQNKEPNNDHQDFHNNFKGKKGPNLAALAAVEWNWKESPWGAGSVQIESTCWSLESELKGFVLFWLSCFIDTSYINLSKTFKKSKSCVWQGRLVSWAERFLTLVTTQWQQMLFSITMCWADTDFIQFMHGTSQIDW